jgi:PKD repeat protein
MMRRIWLLPAAALLAAACSDAGGPESRSRNSLTPAGTGITLDQQSSVLNDGEPWPNGGTHVGKDFNPSNPHHGDAIVATFIWRGTSNTITEVTDHLCDGANTPVGNVYTLVDYVTAGGYSMATYVATNVQGFPDPAATTDQLLCVHAIFSDAITEGGVILSAYQGVDTSAAALGPHLAATGSGSDTTFADPGAIDAGAGALVYGLSMVDGPIDKDPPPDFTNITDVADAAIRADAEYQVAANGGSVDPRWTWYFQSPHTWFATALALNPAPAPANQPPVAAFTSSCDALTCAFTSTSTDPDGSIGTYSWDFGDGTTSAEQNPSHAYGAAGTYTVTLTVADNQNATNAVSSSVTVTVPTNQAPVVNAGPNETVVFGLLYTLNASFTDPDNGPWTYTINWGDGSSSSGSRSTAGSFSVGHTYFVPLTRHTVTVTVTDSRGASGSAAKVVTVLL